MKADFPRILLWIIRTIDKYVGDLSGRVFFFLIFPMVGGLTYEVIARYLFAAPTIWAYDITYMLYGSHFMLGATYTLYKKGHIRTDIIYERLSVRAQGWIDAIAYLFLFFPGMIYFFAAGWHEAVHAWMILERADTSPWAPPMYPFKTVIPLAAAMLVIQGVSEFLKSLHAALHGEWL
jgi:TRAP-type mannitol/chloroaromatic compound transport system permease small subunit